MIDKEKEKRRYIMGAVVYFINLLISGYMRPSLQHSGLWLFHGLPLTILVVVLIAVSIVSLILGLRLARQRNWQAFIWLIGFAILGPWAATFTLLLVE